MNGECAGVVVGIDIDESMRIFVYIMSSIVVMFVTAA